MPSPQDTGSYSLTLGHSFFPSKRELSWPQQRKQDHLFNLVKADSETKGVSDENSFVLLCDLVKSERNVLVSDVSRHYRLAFPNPFLTQFVSELSSGSDSHFCSWPQVPLATTRCQVVFEFVTV